jgi:ATP-dependent Clp protease adapter protein ClpS
MEAFSVRESCQTTGSGQRSVKLIFFLDAPSTVILRLCAIMEDMDEDQANEVFKQAQMAGKAMAGIFPFEKAELIKEQLLRSDPMIFADMAEDKN